MLRPIALLLTILTGFSGLVYEVTWQKALATLLGSHAEATAAVLGIFLGGLSVGYSLFGVVTRRLVARAERNGRPPRLLLVYGGVEAAIGLHALAFIALFRGVQTLSYGLPDTNGGLAFAVDVGLTVLLIGPPTVLMGGTIPVLTQALASSLRDATRVHAFVYAFNTAGAFAGALSAGFVLIPWLGVEGVLRAMGALNLVAGAAFGLLGGIRRSALRAGAGETRSHVRGFALYAGVALLLGFAMMSVQTVLIRLGGLSFGASHFTFAMVVAVFVLCIALGSFAVSALPRIPDSALPVCVWSLFALLALLHLAADTAPYHAHVLRTFFRDEDAAFYPYYVSAFLALLAVIGLPVALSGAALPLLFHHLREQVGDLGSLAGRLYSWNTVGNLLGALLGGYALLFWLDLHQVYRVALCAVAVSAALLTWRATRTGPAAAGLGLAAALALAWAALPDWDPDRLASGLFRAREAVAASYAGPALFHRVHDQAPVIFYRDGPAASVAVKENEKGQRSIVSNGKSDGSTGADYPTMGLIPTIACLLAERCERAFIVGYGTGVSAGEMAALDTVEEVVVAEISSGVIEAAPLFDFANLAASHSPKVRIVRSDAYRALLRSEGRYDVIASEPSNPWVVGVEMLYSREFLEAAKARLRPGGVFCQWLHAYETDAATIELVLRTYASVFERVAVWYTVGADLLLLGLAEDVEVDLERLRARAARRDFRGALQRSNVRTFPELLAHELLPAGALHALDLPGEVHTLLHPVLSHRAARAFFRGGEAHVPSAAEPGPAAIAEARSLLLRHVAATGPLGREDRAAVVKQLCYSQVERCATGLAWWRHHHPGDPELAGLLERLRRTPGGDRLSEPLLTRLERLYARPPYTGWPRRFHLEAAQAHMDAFERHYLPALPFRREALGEVWKRCRDGSGRCSRGRAAVEQLGALP